MLKNDLTKEMPCWNCAKYKHPDESSCPILKTFTDLFVARAEKRINIRAFMDSASEMTFKCSKFEERTCPKCGALISPLETETEDGCISCCEEEEI